MTKGQVTTKRIGVLMGGFSSERDVSVRSGLAIYQALQELGAYGIDKAVTSTVLASKLIVGAEGDDPEAHQKRVDHMARALVAKSRSTLELYTYRKGKSIVWGLLEQKQV